MKKIKVKFIGSKTAYRIINGVSISDEEMKDRLKKSQHKKPFIKLHIKATHE